MRNWPINNFPSYKTIELSVAIVLIHSENYLELFLGVCDSDLRARVRLMTDGNVTLPETQSSSICNRHAVF
jgi:hypothetical protein